MQVKFLPVFGFAQPASWVEFLSDAVGKSYFCISVSGENSLQYRDDFSQLFTRAQVTSALELHQACQDAVQAAEKAGVYIELVAGFFDFAEHRCSLCATQGKVLLKRAGKVGQILESVADLQIIEGKLQLEDVFFFVLQSANSTTPLIENALPGAKQLADLENELTKKVRAVAKESPESGAKTQLAVVGLQMSNGEQSDPPLTAGQIIAQGDEVTSEKFHADVTEDGQPRQSLVTSVGSTLKAIGVGFTAFFSKDVYVRRQATQRALKIIIPAVIVIALLIAFVVYQTVRHKQDVQRAQVIIQPIEQRLAEIKQTVTTNPLQARQDTEDLIVQLDGKIKQETHKTTADELRKELTNIKNYYSTISGLEEFPALQPFYDLRLVKSDFLANRMDLQDNTLIFLDSGQGKIIALSTDQKQWTDIPTGGAAEMKDVVLQGQYAYVIGNGLYRLNLSNQKDDKQLRENTDLLQNSTGMRLYQQYIYVISVAQNNIFRFSPDDKDKDKLSDPIGWLHQPITFDLNQLQSFAIDGDVWIGTKTGEVKKFTTGQAADFSLTGMKENFTTPITIYTKEDMENLYILEPAKERLVAVSKTGEFVKEVKSPTFASTTSLVANEKTKKAYVLSGALIYQVDL